MTEAKQQFTYATIPLRRDHLRQPALLDPLSPNKGGTQPARMAFCARLSSQRRAKRKTEKLVQELTIQAQKQPSKEGGEHRAAS